MAFEVFIEPGRSEKNYWKDLWRYRELFYILSWWDIKVRYKQTIIGVVWSVLRPLLTGMFLSPGVIIIFLLIGIRTFRKMEKSFADLI